MRRRDFITGLGAATACPFGAGAQMPSNLKTILWVSTEAQPDPFIASFRDAMRARGFVEGQNIAFTLQYAPGDPAALRERLPAIIGTPADLIVSSGPAILAMRAATDRPVLFAISGDPVALGIAQSFSRPGRNFTGSTFLSLDVAQKRVQLIRELLPNLRTLAVLSQKNHPGERSEYEATQQAADALDVTSRSRRGPKWMMPFSASKQPQPKPCSCSPMALRWFTGRRLLNSQRCTACPPCLDGANTAMPVVWLAMGRVSEQPMLGLRSMRSAS